MSVGNELVAPWVHFLIHFRKQISDKCKNLSLSFPESNRGTDKEIDLDGQFSNFGKVARRKFRRKTRSIFSLECDSHSWRRAENFGDSTASLNFSDSGGLQILQTLKCTEQRFLLSKMFIVLHFSVLLRGERRRASYFWRHPFGWRASRQSLQTWRIVTRRANGLLLCHHSQSARIYGVSFQWKKE